MADKDQDEFYSEYPGEDESDDMVEADDDVVMAGTEQPASRKRKAENQASPKKCVNCGAKREPGKRCRPCHNASQVRFRF